MAHTPSSTSPDAARTLALGAIAGLAVLKFVMLVALFTRTPPYPPLEFAPLFGAALALSALCAALIQVGSRWFLAPTGLLIAESLLSFGPHKFYPGESAFFAQTPVVYPAIAVGTLLILVLGGSAWRLYRG